MTESERKIIDELSAILKETKENEKHRYYHLLPERLYRLDTDGELQPKFVFYEKERLAYIKSKLDIKGHSILDIGCNTGYILFDLLDSGAKKVTGYEGKELCANFLNRAIVLLGEKNRFEFHHEYFNFENVTNYYDTIVLLNVLHHVGDDYGDKSLSIQKAKQKILDQINTLGQYTSNLIYQMGFNWQGNVKQCLFENGTKAEMIDYLREGLGDHWEFKEIGIAERTGGVVMYKDLNEQNIKRDDSLGEFLNRPIFILKSKKVM